MNSQFATAVVITYDGQYASDWLRIRPFPNLGHSVYIVPDTIKRS